MVLDEDKPKFRWWKLFQQSRLPAYVTLVEPQRKALKLKLGSQHKLQVIELDDAFDDAVLDEEGHSSEPATCEIRVGSVMVALPDGAGTAQNRCGPPWPFLVDGIWLVAGPGLSDPVAAAAEAAAWERRQLQQGRLASKHFKLDVTYFYRVHDLDDDDISAADMRKVTDSLAALGIGDSSAGVAPLVKERLASRYLIFSTHQARLPEPDGARARGAGADAEDEGEGEEDDEEFDEPIPLEGVLAPAQVLFLGASEKVPAYTAAPAAAAVSANRSTQRMLPASKQASFTAKQQQLAQGFLCNLIYVKQTSQLFTLQEWADGSAGADVEGAWAEHSRRQVKELLKQTRTHLAEVKRTARRQQQQQQEAPDSAASPGAGGQGDAAADAPMADAPAGDEDEEGSGRQQQQQRLRRRLSHRQDELVQQRGSPHTLDHEQLQKQHRERLRGRLLAADGDSDPEAAGARKPRRSVQGIESSPGEDSGSGLQHTASAAAGADDTGNGAAMARAGSDKQTPGSRHKQQQQQQQQQQGAKAGSGAAAGRTPRQAPHTRGAGGGSTGFATAVMRTGKAVLSTLLPSSGEKKRGRSPG